MLARAAASSFRHYVFNSTITAAALTKSPLLASRRFLLPMSQAIPPSHFPAARLGGVRCKWNLPDLDYNRWLIIMDKPGGEGASKQQIIDCYVQTLAKILGSKEEAKKKIYNVSCERNPLTNYNFGFGCEIDEETAKKLEGLPGVLFVLPVPDSYVDHEHKDYGGNFSNSAYSPHNLGWGNFSDRAPIEMATLFHGCDYNHWLILMDKPGGEGASNQQMIDCYVQTLAKILGSEEEAKKKIYNVSCQKNLAFFGCEVDKETSKKLAGLPEILNALADSYADPVHKDYGAELFLNGEIVQRSPERERMVGTKYTFAFDED